MSLKGRPEGLGNDRSARLEASNSAMPPMTSQSGDLSFVENSKNKLARPVWTGKTEKASNVLCRDQTKLQ